MPVGPEVADVLDRVVADEEPEFAFPTRFRCPQRGTTNTVARSTHGRIQYRMCRACGHGDPRAGGRLWKLVGDRV